MGVAPLGAGRGVGWDEDEVSALRSPGGRAARPLVLRRHCARCVRVRCAHALCVFASSMSKRLRACLWRVCGVRVWSATRSWALCLSFRSTRCTLVYACLFRHLCVCARCAYCACKQCVFAPWLTYSARVHCAAHAHPQEACMHAYTRPLIARMFAAKA